MTLQEFEKITSNSGVSTSEGNTVQTIQGNLYNWTLVYLPAGNDRMGNSMITIALFQEILENNTNVSNYVDAYLGTYKKNRGAIMCQLYSIRSIQKDILEYIQHTEKIDAEYKATRKNIDDCFKFAQDFKKKHNFTW